MELLHNLSMPTFGQRIEGYGDDAQDAAEEWDEGCKGMDAFQNLIRLRSIGKIAKGSKGGCDHDRGDSGCEFCKKRLA